MNITVEARQTVSTNVAMALGSDYTHMRRGDAPTPHSLLVGSLMVALGNRTPDSTGLIKGADGNSRIAMVVGRTLLLSDALPARQDSRSDYRAAVEVLPASCITSLRVENTGDDVFDPFTDTVGRMSTVIITIRDEEFTVPTHEYGELLEHNGTFITSAMRALELN